MKCPVPILYMFLPLSSINDQFQSQVQIPMTFIHLKDTFYPNETYKRNQIQTGIVKGVSTS